MSDETIMPFDFPAENPTIIKVIGVGGGGGKPCRRRSVIRLSLDKLEEKA